MSDVSTQAKELVENLHLTKDIVQDSLDGKRGEDQQRIAETVIAWGEVLLKKNRDYGGSAWKVPVLLPGMSAGDAIMVRMCDKIERIRSLTEKGESEVSESLEDTVQDLGAYCLLWLARPVVEV